MTKTDMYPSLVRSKTRLFAGMFIVPVSLLSIVLILALYPHPLFAIFPLPTLIIGTAMIILELRNRIEKHDTVVERASTSAGSNGSVLEATVESKSEASALS